MSLSSTSAVNNAGWSPVFHSSISITIRLQEYSSDVLEKVGLEQVNRKLQIIHDEREGNQVFKKEMEATTSQSTQSKFEFRETFTIACERQANVFSLKQKIHSTVGINPEFQKLIFLGRCAVVQNLKFRTFDLRRKF
jgi:hypothetical protein